MRAFWKHARQMLHYRRLLVLGGLAALLDAACAFSGFGIVMLLLDQIFGHEKTIQGLVHEKLSDPRVVELIGDRSALAEQVIPADNFDALAFVLAVVIGFVALGATMRFLYQNAALNIVLRTIMRLRKSAYQRLIHAPYELLLAEGSADMLSRITRDTAALSKGFNAVLGKTVRDVLMLIVFLSLAFISHWKLTLIFLLVAPLIMICLRVFGRKIRKAARRAMRAYGGMLGAMQESTQAMAVVKVHNAEGYERRRFNCINRRVLRQEMKARIVRALSSPVVDLIAIVGICIVCLVMGWMVYHGGVAPPALLKVGMMLAAAGAAMRPIATLNNTLNEAAAAAVRIEEVLNLPVESNARVLGRHDLPGLAPHRESVRFENVSYAYPEAKRDAVREVNLEVRFGQTVAVVGPNGSGKSTLLYMLPRLIDPRAGRITIDGEDIAGVSLRSLRRQMAVVTQQTVLFEGTIADNIAYGHGHAGAEQIEAAARAAYAHEFIEPLAAGYRSELGEMGSGLSGGQRQRLCIARAILRDPSILILDEATSQIDADSEAKINQALQSLRLGRTTFVIAHRLSTVIDADLIVVMDDGAIVDQGRHEQLLQRCRVYQILTRTQLGDDRAA